MHEEKTGEKKEYPAIPARTQIFAQLLPWTQVHPLITNSAVNDPFEQLVLTLKQINKQNVATLILNFPMYYITLIAICLPIFIEDKE